MKRIAIKRGAPVLAGKHSFVLRPSSNLDEMFLAPPLVKMEGMC